MTAGKWRVPLSIQAGATQASWTGVRLMIGYRALEGGANPLFLGLLASAFALPALITALPAGRLSDRVGGSAVATSGLLVAGIGVTITLLFPSLPILLVASAVIGLGHILIMVGQQTFVAHATTRGSSDAAFGTLTAAASIGQLIGPPAVTIFGSVLFSTATATVPNTDIGLLVCLGFTAIALPAIAFLRSTDRALRSARSKAPEPSAPTLHLLRTRGLWQSLVVSGAVLVSVDLMYAFLPVWAVENGISATAVGLLLALRAAVSVISRFGLTRLVSRFGRKTLIIVSIAAAAAGLIALPFVGLWGAIPVMIGLGLGLGIPQPLTMSWVTSLTPRASHGAVLGMRLTSNRLAQISLPLAVGAIAAPLGIIGIFWSNALLLVAAIAVMSRSNAGDPPQ